MKDLQFCIVCNHSKKMHVHRKTDVSRLDDICWDCNAGYFDKYHAFKLDNLKLIEQLAKEKGLI